MHGYEFRQGRSPLIVSMPHVGSYVPIELRDRMSAAGRMVADTDWDLDLLYRFLWLTDATIITSRLSRYVIDLNRDPEGKPLYAGMNHPSLVPTRDFDEVPLYHPGEEPDQDEIASRLDRYWRPYHGRLAGAVEENRNRHGYAVLFDCHSIRSVVTRYMPGRIPDLNLGTADGASCSPVLRERLAAILRAQDRYSVAVDDVFKGGFITRHYGRPPDGVHSFQLEMSRAVYMQEQPSPVLDPGKCDTLEPTLKGFIAAAEAWTPQSH